MELIIAIILTTNIITNLIVIGNLIKFQSNKYEIFINNPALVENSLSGNETEEILPLPLEEVPVVPPKTVEGSYHAWENRIEEPVKASPSPHGPPPKPGPLERPTGFSR